VAEADGDLDALRRTFLLKAFQRRQKALLDVPKWSVPTGAGETSVRVSPVRLQNRIPFRAAAKAVAVTSSDRQQATINGITGRGSPS